MRGTKIGTTLNLNQQLFTLKIRHNLRGGRETESGRKIGAIGFKHESIGKEINSKVTHSNNH